jgi:polar amino acid transport system substrate-binding protein
MTTYRTGGYRARALVCLAVVGLLAGCSAARTPGASPTGYPAARPLGVQDPAVIPSTSAGPAQTCNPRASLRPPDPLPAPGSMPANSTMARIQQGGKLRVGVDQNTFLFGYRNPASGQIEGFDIDVARRIAKAIFGSPDKIQLIAITSAQRIPYVQEGKVDLVADTMTINCSRLQQVSFSTVYYDAGQRVLVNKGAPYKGIDDFGGKKVCAAAGSTSIANIAARPNKPVPVAVQDWTDCMVLLQQGQVEAISTDDTILAGMADQDPNLQLVGPKFTEEPYGLAMSKTATDLVRFVNGVLDQMRDDGTLHQINVSWLKENAPAAVPSAVYQD